MNIDLQKLTKEELKDAAFIVFKTSAENSENLEMLAREFSQVAMRNPWPENCTVIFTAKDIATEVFTEEMMKELGWQRINKGEKK